MEDEKLVSHNRDLVNKWLVESLRVTVFTIGKVTKQNWWESLLKMVPDEKTEQPKTGTILTSGKFEEGLLRLGIGSDRIDWLYTPIIEAKLGTMVNLGSFDVAFSPIEKITLDWFKLEDFPMIYRLALGVVLLHAVEDEKSGYKLLSEYLQFDLEPDNTSDFLYQINRPRDLDIGTNKLKINRLTKWSLAHTRWFHGGALVSSGNIQHQEELYSCRLELDINNVPINMQPLSKENLTDIFSKIVSFANEIILKGDIE